MYIVYIYMYVHMYMCIYIHVYGMLLLLQYPIVTSCYFGFCGYLQQAGLDGSWAEPAMGHHHLITVVRGSTLCCLRGNRKPTQGIYHHFFPSMTDFWTQALRWVTSDPKVSPNHVAWGLNIMGWAVNQTQSIWAAGWLWSIPSKLESSSLTGFTWNMEWSHEHLWNRQPVISTLRRYFSVLPGHIFPGHFGAELNLARSCHINDIMIYHVIMAETRGWKVRQNEHVILQ